MDGVDANKTAVPNIDAKLMASVSAILKDIASHTVNVPPPPTQFQTRNMMLPSKPMSGASTIKPASTLTSDALSKAVAEV